MKEQKKVIRWIKDHKKELIIAGVSIAAVIGAILLYKNRKALKAYWDYLVGLIQHVGVAKTPGDAVKAAENVAKVTEEVAKATEAATHTAEVIPFEVAKHIRNLPDGWHASPGKIASAVENGVALAEGQTWVDCYWKGVAV